MTASQMLWIHPQFYRYNAGIIKDGNTDNANWKVQDEPVDKGDDEIDDEADKETRE